MAHKEGLTKEALSSSWYQVAEDIATAILTTQSSTGGTECTRAQMMLKDGDSEKNMGGRNKNSIITTTLNVLDSLEPPVKKEVIDDI